MLAYLRNVYLWRASGSWTAVVHSRSLSSSAVVRQEETEEEGGGASETGRDGPFIPEDPKFEQWLETEGKKYEKPHRPRNWLGGQVPFPLNPSFKPPTPVSNQLRTTIYDEYMSNPAVYNVRKLSERHGLSIQRIDAILRLKGLEEHWKRLNKMLQTGFLAGMEQILGVTERQATMRLGFRGSGQGAQELGEDTSQADIHMDAEANHRARERYQRLFWEPVVEGQDPIVPRELERARIEDRKTAKIAAEHKAARAGVPPHKHEERLIDVPGRPSLKFIDVGGKYVDVDDRIRRLKESQRRSKLKLKKRLRKVESRKSIEAEAASLH